MITRSELEQLVDDLVTAEPVAPGSELVLAAALDRVAITPQERYLTQRLFGDRRGLSPALRLALAVAAVAVLLTGAFVLAGGLLRRPDPTPPHGGNGWITYSTSEAGHDIYVANTEGLEYRIVGAEGDGIDHGCQVFGADGRRLGYVESRFPSDMATEWAAVVVDVDQNGQVASERARITLPGPLVSCPRWAPDLSRIAWLTSPDQGGDVLLARIDGSVRTLLHGPGAGPDVDGGLEGITWSPTGDSLVIVATTGSAGTPNHSSALRLVPTLPGWTARDLVPPMAQSVVGGMSFSPDASEVGFQIVDVPTDTARLVIVEAETGETQLEEAGGDPSGPVWSPDGALIAYVSDHRVVVSAPDGWGRHLLPPIMLDVPAYAFGVTWAPDGARLLVTAGDAPFVDRGVRFTVVSVDPSGIQPTRVVAPWRDGFYTEVGWQERPG